MSGGLEVSRRTALAAAMVSGPLGCRSSSRAGARTAPEGAAAPDPWGGLRVATAGPMRQDEHGGVAVVLLHGWGAPGDDLLPLAHALARPGSRFFVPAAPLPETGGGRAWWHLMASDRPAFALEDRPTPGAGSQTHPALAAARAAVQAVLRTIVARHKPDALVLAGFSQGAMLSLDVALAAAPPVDRVAALSGVLLADSLPGLRAPRAHRPAVFLSHGRGDSILPFRGGEHAKSTLAEQGFPITWHPFDGGHEIPPDVVAALRSFVFP
jgi:phospholipase/carboxylesterase